MNRLEDVVVLARLADLPPKRRGKPDYRLALVIRMHDQHPVVQHCVGPLIGSLSIICRDHAELHWSSLARKWGVGGLAAAPHPMPPTATTTNAAAIQQC
jgi:hypothetical protein